MDERVMQFRVGVMVLATLIITAILVLLFGNMPPLVGGGGHIIRVLTRGASSVTTSTQVYKSGVRIGRVIEKPAFTEDGRVVIVARIEHGLERELYDNDRCEITLSSFGDAKLEFTAGGVDRGNPIKSDHIFQGEPSLPPMQMVDELRADLHKVTDSVRETSGELNKVARKVSDILDANQGRITRMIEHADTTMTAIETVAQSANSLLADPEVKESFKKTLREAPDLLHEVRNAAMKMTESFISFDHSLQDIRGLTAPLRERGTKILDHVDSTMQDLNMITGRLSKITEDIDSGRGTLGLLIKDPDLYKHLDCAAANVDQMVHDLRPVIADFRVFSDKVARHPETLGVRGAIERRPGIK